MIFSRHVIALFFFFITINLNCLFFIYFHSDTIFFALLLKSLLYSPYLLTILKYFFGTCIISLPIKSNTSYYLYFRRVDNVTIPAGEREKTGKSIIDFVSGFFPVLVILFLALLLQFPFHLSVLIGVLVGLLKKPPEKGLFQGYLCSIRSFILKGINYQLALPVLVMVTIDLLQTWIF